MLSPARCDDVCSKRFLSVVAELTDLDFYKHRATKGNAFKSILYENNYSDAARWTVGVSKCND